MPPTNVNRPRLRTFSFPIISATLVGLFELLIYFASHGTPSQFNLGGVGFPLDEGSVFRTVVGGIFYALVVAHFWEMSQVYRLCEQHRADGVTTVLYIVSTLFFGFTIIDEIKRQVKLARVDTISSKKTK